MVNPTLFNRVLEALKDLEAATEPIEIDKAAKRVATAATKLRQDIANAVAFKLQG